MWGRIVEEVRRAGPRKLAILLIAAAAAVALAYGVNSTNDAASGRTQPRSAEAVSLSTHAPSASATERR